MCKNPNSEQPGSANSTINVKSLDINDVDPKHDWIVEVNYTFGGSRSISFENYEHAKKLFNHYVKSCSLQRIKKVYLNVVQQAHGKQYEYPVAFFKFYSE